MNMVVGAALTGSAVSQPITDADPIFAAIEVHRNAKANFEACFKPGERSSDEVLDHYSSVEQEAACGLLNIVPTTLRGVLALVVYAAEVDQDGMGWPDGLVTDQAQKLGKSWYFYAMKTLAEAMQAHSELMA